MLWNCSTPFHRMTALCDHDVQMQFIWLCTALWHDSQEKAFVTTPKNLHSSPTILWPHSCKSGTNGVTLSHVDSTIYEGLWRCIWIYNSFHDRTSQVWTWMHGVQFKMVHKSYSFAQSSLAYWKLTAVSLAANFAILLSPLFHLLTNSLSSPPDSLTLSPSVSCRKIFQAGYTVLHPHAAVVTVFETKYFLCHAKLDNNILMRALGRWGSRTLLFAYSSSDTDQSIKELLHLLHSWRDEPYMHSISLVFSSSVYFSWRFHTV